MKPNTYPCHHVSFAWVSNFLFLYHPKLQGYPTSMTFGDFAEIALSHRHVEKTRRFSWVKRIGYSNPWPGYSSMFRRFYVQKVLCSEGFKFRRFYVQKVLYSEGSIFRRFYVQKVLCSEIFVQKVLCLESTLAIKQYYLFNLSESVYIYNKKYVF